MTKRHPVVFIHGLWLHANSWGQWAALFAAHGYATVAPGWPGEEPTVQATRDSRSAQSRRGITEVVQHYAEITTALETRPVLIGHGLGGLLALTIAADTHAAGVIAIDALPVTAMTPPGRELTAWQGAAALSRDEFRMVYGRALSGQESDQLYERWAIPAPDWALREPVIPDPVAPRPGARTTNSSRGPTLLVASGLIGGQCDTRPASAERGLLGVASDVVVFSDRGPSLVIDSGWRKVATSCLSWMDAQEL